MNWFMKPFGCSVTTQTVNFWNARYPQPSWSWSRVCCQKRVIKLFTACRGEEVKIRLVDLGMLAYRLLELFEGSAEESYATVLRLFEEQFEVSDQKTILPKPKESIAADSIQSPHDPDCHYSNKDGNQVKGYSVNVTESGDKQGLNLTSNVEVKKVDAADNGFLEKGVVQAGKVHCIRWKTSMLTGLTTVLRIRRLLPKIRQNCYLMPFRDQRADMTLDWMKMGY